MKYSLIVFVICFSFYSCGSKEGESTISTAKTINEILTGEWRNVTLDVKLFSAGGKNDSMAVIKVKEGQWESVMQFKPIRTHFLATNKGTNSGGYYSDYLALDGSFLFRRTGIYKIKGDSITIQEEGLIYNYFVEVLSDDELAFTSLMDWDSDGVVDDEYFGIQKKH